ncbi:MAG: lysophospholipid acyltransferase family protein [Bacteroidales bacterium]
MRGLYFIYQWLILIPVLFVVTVITALVTIIGCRLGNGDFWGYYPGHIWSRIFCFLSLVPVKVNGKENIRKNVSYVFVANHQGAFDIFLIYGYLNHNFKWMMKKSLRKMPLIGKACEDAGHIFVDDSGAKGVRTTIQQAEKTLRDGMSLVVFPEGSRTLDGRIHRFKRGAFQLAQDIQLAVVPLTIEGPYKVMKRGTYQIFPHRMTLTIHEPILVDPNNPDEAERLRKESFRIISSELEEN